jgi:hypothetical protein
MAMKLTMWIAAALGLPTAGAAVPPPPAVLSPYVVDGRFLPHDFNWLRGAFPGASPAERTAFEQVNTWKNDCFAADQRAVLGELSKMGVAVERAAITTPRDPLCSSVSIPDLRQFKSFEDLQAADAAAKPIAESFLYAVKLADESLLLGPTLGDALRNRPVTEQMLRRATSWGMESQGSAPPLSAPVKMMVEQRIGMAIAERDHANTEWLKRMIDKSGGWPKISAVGREASQSAWLLVQHADADPPFQLRALRLMEPLVAGGEVDKSNYAYLYDRVMLKIAGKQRYGTQMTCRAGKRVAQPLESESELKTRRVEAGLPPFSEYLDMMKKAFGDCPPER